MLFSVHGVVRGVNSPFTCMYPDMLDFNLEEWSIFISIPFFGRRLYHTTDRKSSWMIPIVVINDS